MKPQLKGEKKYAYQLSLSEFSDVQTTSGRCVEFSSLQSATLQLQKEPSPFQLKE